MTLISLLKLCYSTTLIAFIPLAIQYLIALVISLYHFKNNVMPENVVTFAGCCTSLVRLAVGLGCDLQLGQRLFSTTPALAGLLCGAVEMVAEAAGVFQFCGGPVIQCSTEYLVSAAYEG